MPVTLLPQRRAALLLTALLVACGPQSGNDSSTVTTTETASADMADATSEAATTDATSVPAPAVSTTTPAPTTPTLGSQITRQSSGERSLLVEASADFEVADVVQAADTIEGLARRAGGFVTSSIVNSHDEGQAQYPLADGQRLSVISYTRRAEVKGRVPRARLTEFLAQVQAEIGHLRSRTVTAQDVTFDLERARLEQEIGALKAGKISEQVLDPQGAAVQAGNLSAIEREALAQREAAYADLQGRELQDRVDYSLVRLTFDQPALTREERRPDPAAQAAAHTPPFGERLATSLRTGWRSLEAFVLAAASAWPLLLGLGLIAALWQQVNRRRPVKSAEQVPPRQD